MAQVYGKPGGFAKDEYTRRMLRNFFLIYAVFIFAAAAIGFVCGLGQNGGVISLWCLGGLIVFASMAWLVLVPRFERFLDRRRFPAWMSTLRALWFSHVLPYSGGNWGDAFVADAPLARPYQICAIVHQSSILIVHQ